jgi:hypothetical protein
MELAFNSRGSKPPIDAMASNPPSYPKGVACTCEESCQQCDHTGSVFRVGRRIFPNTLDGYVEACEILSLAPILCQDDFDEWRPR